MKTAVLLALLGYTNAAAAPSALPPASTSSRAWKWTDASAPATTDLDGKHVKAEWSNATVGTTIAGPLKGYMTGIVTCLTQNISAGVTAGTAKTPSQSVADVGTTKAFTFWPADAANIGTYVAKPTYDSTSDAAGTKLASGSLWKVMNDADAADFVGGLGCLLTATDEYKANAAFIANRVWAKVDQSGD